MQAGSRFVSAVVFAQLIAAAAPGAAAVPARTAAEPVNMLSLQEGTLPVVVPPHYGGWGAERLLDDSASSGWACKAGHTQNNVFVFELAADFTFDRFEFDNAAIDSKGASARELIVEVSATSSSAGFKQVLKVSLADKTDKQNFPASTKVSGRWLRLTLLNNHGDPKYTELFSIRGLGARPPTPKPASISGTYDSSYSTFHVRQQGTALVGCYEYQGGLLNGVIEGRVMKISWQENQGPGDRGPAVMVFSADGKTFSGFWWNKGNAEGAPNGQWRGTKKSTQIGGCPHWAGSVSGELKRQLDSGKRARLYGLLFDFDSAVLRAESKPVLDEILVLLKGEPGWKLTIEGHTDAVGVKARNLKLSQQRAASVRRYLVEAGIAAGRLKTVGLGESQPVADNSTELGRAQNRRVELVRE